MASTTSTETNIYDEILEVQESSLTNPCTVERILAQLDEDTRSGILKAFQNPDITGTTITTVLERRGFRLSSRTLQRHRARTCGCFRGNRG